MTTKNIRISVTVGIMIAFAITMLIILRSPTLFLAKHVNSDLGFEMGYPWRWHIQQGQVPGSSENPYVRFSGELSRKRPYFSRNEQCDTYTYTGSITITKWDAPLRNGKSTAALITDFKKNIYNQGVIIDSFPLNDNFTLITAEDHSGSGMCEAQQHSGWVISSDGNIRYHIVFDGADARYDIFKKVVASFKLLDHGE